jgi:hypothetical protein
MSFIKLAAIGFEEAQVLQFAVKRVVPQLEAVVKEATGDRLEKAKIKLDVSKEMLEDLDQMLTK